VEVSIWVTIWENIRPDIFGVAKKLSHDTRPTHVSSAIAGNQTSCQTSNSQISLLGRDLNLLMWLFITIFLFLVSLEAPHAAEMCYQVEHAKYGLQIM
jgi:hypothetical protein